MFEFEGVQFTRVWLQGLVVYTDGHFFTLDDGTGLTCVDATKVPKTVTPTAGTLVSSRLSTLC
jgi:hypothetical protein